MNGIDARKPDTVDRMKFKLEKRPKSVIVPEQLLRQLRAYEELLLKSIGSPYKGQCCQGWSCLS